MQLFSTKGAIMATRAGGDGEKMGAAADPTDAEAPALLSSTAVIN
jgi:hypothetical protein